MPTGPARARRNDRRAAPGHDRPQPRSGTGGCTGGHGYQIQMSATAHLPWRDSLDGCSRNVSWTDPDDCEHTAFMVTGRLYACDACKTEFALDHGRAKHARDLTRQARKQVVDTRYTGPRAAAYLRSSRPHRITGNRALRPRPTPAPSRSHDPGRTPEA